VDRLRKETTRLGTVGGFRSVVPLKPLGGDGDKVAPPTYPGLKKDSPPRYHYEYRKVGDEVQPVVVLDSIQSLANRLEKGLEKEYKGKRLRMPMVQTRFESIGLDLHVTSMPHRIYDSYLRDSLDGKTQVYKTDWFKPLTDPFNLDGVMQAVLQYNPLAAGLGYWGNSSTLKHLSRIRHPRLYVGEVVGVLASGGGWTEKEKGHLAFEALPVAANGDRLLTQGEKTGGRVDPLNLPSMKGLIIMDPNDPASWRLKGPKDKASKYKLSNLMLGNIPSDLGRAPGGVSCSQIACTATLGLAGLYEISPFDDEAKNVAARTLVAALVLHGHVTFMSHPSWHLRSGCSLVPQLTAGKNGLEVPMEAVGVSTTEQFVLTAADTLAAYEQALDEATKLGIVNPKTDIRLRVKPELEEVASKVRAGEIHGGDDEKPGENDE
jgi:CRISPR-associated protein Csb1